MTIDNPVPEPDMLQVEHENDAEAKRTLLVGKTTSGTYLPVILGDGGSLK